MTSSRLCIRVHRSHRRTRPHPHPLDLLVRVLVRVCHPSAAACTVSSAPWMLLLHRAAVALGLALSHACTMHACPPSCYRHMHAPVCQCRRGRPHACTCRAGRARHACTAVVACQLDVAAATPWHRRLRTAALPSLSTPRRAALATFMPRPLCSTTGSHLARSPRRCSASASCRWRLNTVAHARLLHAACWATGMSYMLHC